MVPLNLGGFTSAGVLWRGSETRAVSSTGRPFLEVDLLYGDPDTGGSRTPYDAFSVRLRFVTTDTGDRIRTTHLDAVAQFRPWASKGFFVKGGAGMAFVRNWVDVPDAPAVTSKALSVVIGAGWAFRTADRFGVQVFAPSMPPLSVTCKRARPTPRTSSATSGRSESLSSSDSDACAARGRIATGRS